MSAKHSGRELHLRLSVISSSARPEKSTALLIAIVIFDRLQSSQQRSYNTGLDRVDDPRGANVGVGDRVVRQPEAAAGDDQLELGLGRVRQRGEAGQSP